MSDLPYAVVSNGWGPVEKDTSNSELAAGDGKVITLNGATFAKGLGVHANSVVTLALNGMYSTFQANVGVDDEVGSQGSVDFQVWADDVKLFDSGLMTGSSATRGIDVSVAGRSQLKLIVTNGGDGIDFDHADWAGARGAFVLRFQDGHSRLSTGSTTRGRVLRWHGKIPSSGGARALCAPRRGGRAWKPWRTGASRRRASRGSTLTSARSAHRWPRGPSPPRSRPTPARPTRRPASPTRGTSVTGPSRSAARA